MSKPVVIACTCGAQSSNWWKHEQNCAMKLAGLLSEARTELAELKLEIIAATGQAQTALEENAKLRTLAKAHDLNDYKTYIKWRGIEAGWDRELTPTELGDILAAAALKGD